MKQQDLDKYFSTIWKFDLSQYNYSGWQLIDKIQPHELVLDVGCGTNLFKSHIANLIGVDPAFDEADVKSSIESFAADTSNHSKFDVAFCLGSINFGNEANILNQIEHVVKLLKPHARIYWRCNPGLADHGNDECTSINFYPWTIEKQIEFAERFGFNCNLIRWDINNRIYAEWHR
jgi:SAM-dependent methyltransferase